MWNKLTSSSYLALAFMLLFPLTVFARHPHSQYDPNAAPWIGIALSGGGLRAAAFSHGVMLELRKLCLLKPPEDSPALDNQHDHDSPPTQFSLHYLEETDYSDDDRSSPCGRGGGASFLDNAHFLSGVSGGAITAAYYKTHPDRLTEFGQALKEARLAKELITGKKTTPILRPPLMLLASLLDTIFQVFKLPILPIPEVEVAPLATMWLYDGLFESEQLTPAYNTLFLHGHTFGELEEQTHRADTLAEALLGERSHSPTSIGRAHLLIHATDIANGRVFTFDKETFACLGDVESFRKLDLATAVAASSSLPGVFSPMKLKSLVKAIEAKRIPTNCPLILGDQVRSPILVDGGVSDNLGVTGLLRAIFERKNRAEFQNDDRVMSEGRGLELLPIQITRSSLSQAEPKPITTAQQDNPKSQKAFLLIVNAGVSATSNLPGMGGNLDDSFDILIRDRTDLSRIVAQHLLDNFGFRVVELNMRDLVKSNRIVTRIVKQSLAIQNKTASTADSIREIAQAFDFTEMERKVLSDLNNVGLLPSKDEIDTLILAGRAVVAELSGTIKQEYEALVDKDFAASCDRIINPDRHYCWPPSFETPHVVANKVGVLLDVLTKTSEDFARTTTANRSMQLAQIRSQLWDLYKDETKALHSLGILPGREKTKSLVICRIKQDALLASALSFQSRDGSFPPVPACDPSEGGLEDSLTLSPDTRFAILTRFATLVETFPNIEEDKLSVYELDLLNPDASPEALKKTKEPIDSWANQVVAHLLKDDRFKDESPWYDYLLAGYSMIQERTAEGFHYLYRGATTFPDDYNLSFLLGYYSIHFNLDFHGGLQHLASAIDKARSKRNRIEWLLSGQLGERDRTILRKRFQRAEDYFSLQHAKYIALSPLPIKGRSEFISDEKVASWLNQSFSDGHGGNDFATLLRFTERPKEVSRKTAEASYCRITTTVRGLYFPIGVKTAIDSFLGHYRDFDDGCKPTAGDDARNVDLLEVPDFPSKSGCRDKQPVCVSFARVQYRVRELLADKNSPVNARGQARRLYESPPKDKIESSPYLWERADVYGLIVLMDAIQKECPKRTEDVRTALRLFRVASASVDQDRRLNKRKVHVDGVKKRIGRLVEVTEDLSCGRDVGL